MFLSFHPKNQPPCPQGSVETRTLVGKKCRVSTFANAPSNRSGSLSAAYKKHEDIKKRAYGQRVRDVEGEVFTPLVFSTTGGMGREATTFYKRLADLLAQKQQKPYPVVINWLRCKLSFAAVRSSIMCIRGTRSSINRPLRDADIILATSEGGIPQDE